MIGTFDKKKRINIFKMGKMKEKAKARVVIDDRIRHGKPIIMGTRITVDEVLRALIGGMNYDEIERGVWNSSNLSGCYTQSASGRQTEHLKLKIVNNYDSEM